MQRTGMRRKASRWDDHLLGPRHDWYGRNRYDFSSRRVHGHANYHRYGMFGQRVGPDEFDHLWVLRSDVYQLRHHRSQLEREYVAFRCRRPFLLAGHGLLAACQSGVWQKSFQPKTTQYFMSFSGGTDIVEIGNHQFCTLAGEHSGPISTPVIAAQDCIVGPDAPGSLSWRIQGDDPNATGQWCMASCLDQN